MKVLLSMVLTGLVVMVCKSQPLKTKIIDAGSNGPYKALAVSEPSLPQHTVYRPQDMKAAVDKGGKLPVIVFANGACYNASTSHEKVLSEIASHGYVVVAIGALQLKPNEFPGGSTPASMLTDALDWITTQSKQIGSDYFAMLDTGKIAAAGQSCGGAQVLAVAKDPRIKASIMFNSGIGDMSMAGATKENLAMLHGPILYVVGGPSDIATNNAELDYTRINQVPVSFANLLDAGHGGTFSQQYGGAFSKMVLEWLDWRFKKAGSGWELFSKSQVDRYPGWTLKSKNL